jgi:hypothetical protein
LVEENVKKLKEFDENVYEKIEIKFKDEFDSESSDEQDKLSINSNNSYYEEDDDPGLILFSKQDREAKIYARLKAGYNEFLKQRAIIDYKKLILFLDISRRL